MADGQRRKDSYAFSIAPVDHWNLVDCVAIVSSAHKKTGSTEGHAIAGTSPLQAARVRMLRADWKFAAMRFSKRF
jgi:diphosphomevalonate decarboxylase